MDDPLRIVREDILFDGYFQLKNLTYDLRRRDGSWLRATREVYANADGAAVLLYDPQRRTVLLTRQFRPGARLAGHEGFVLEVPAGMLDDTDPEQRVRMELMEETGIEAHGLRRIMCLFPNPALLTERVHYYLGEYGRRDRKAEGGGEQEEGEDIEVVEMEFEEALRQVASGGIVDTKTVVLLQALREELRAAGAC
jgi:ADP-ribose pyrophosphatase